MTKRLVAAMVAVVALVLIAHDVPLANQLETIERDRLITALERDAFILAGRFEEALEHGFEPGGRLDFARLVAEYAEAESVRVVVVGDDGIARVESDALDSFGEDYTNRPEIVEALQGRPSTGERESRTLGEELFYVAVPVLSGDQTVGAVRISAPERVVSERVNDQVRGLFVVAGLSLLIAVVVAVLVAWTVVSPMRRLRTATSALASGDLTTRVDDVDGPPEVRELASSFNLMAARIEDLVQRQQAFAGDASHQIRTPLTALRLRLERVAAQIDDRSAQADVEAAMAETERLHRIVEGLLALSRADAAAGAVVDVDVGAVAADRVVYWQALAGEEGVRLDYEGPASLHASAVAGALDQVIDNLVDNALEVSRAGDTITVSVATDPDAVVLRVVDQGPGMPADERERAFDRFWRSAEAPSGGSGLGLAIVRQLVRSGDGTCELREAAGGGLDAVVRLRPAVRPT